MFIEGFTSYLKYEKRYSSHTVAAYLNDLQQFEDFIAPNELKLAEASHHDVRSWIVELMDRNTNAKTVQRKLSSLRTFYKFLQRGKFIGNNPAQQVIAPKASRRLPVFVEEENLNSLLDSKDIFAEGFEGLRDSLVVEILFGTGIRLAELLTLKDSDVDFYQQTLKVFGKRSKERIVPLNASLAKLHKEYISEKSLQSFTNISPSLIVTDAGKPAYAKLIHRIVSKYLSYAGTQQKKSPHVLRHSFATSLLNRGADLNAIKELLGHASLAATQVYTHNSVERLKTIYKQAHPKA